MKKAFFFLSFCTVIISLAQDLQPTATEACLNVSVVDGKKKPQPGQPVTFENSKTKKQYSGVTKDDGKFKLLVPKGATYKLKYKAFSTSVDYSTLTLPLAKDTLLNFNVDIIFQQPKQYTLNNVFFDSGKASLRPESHKELNELAEYMNLKKTLSIEIAGHTDNAGVKETNQKLSESRANAVRDYLLKKGIVPERVVAKGYGDTQPIADNSTENGKQKNRRTEVRIMKD